MKAEHELAGALAERVLELVAVSPSLLRRLDRLQLEFVEAAQAAQRIVDLARLLGQLAGIRSALGSMSSTARASPKSRLALSILARTRSPGSPPETKTT